MTTQEALKIIKEIKKTHLFLSQIHSAPPNDKQIAAYDAAIQALEKKTPEKPILVDKFNAYICPDCKEVICSEFDDKFCSKCSKALDWEMSY